MPATEAAQPAPLVRPTPPLPWWRRLAEPALARMPAVAWSPARLLGAVASVVVLAVVAVVAVPAALRSRAGGPPPENVLPRARPPATSVPAADAGAPDAASLVVHVAGAVADPGVHEVKPGGRVVDAIDAAGGPADDADLDALDLAAKVSDGQRVYVPHQGEVEPGGLVDGGGGGGAGGAGGSAGGDAPVDLNTATADDLDKLPGVGPSLAGAILEYRRSHGRFTSVDQLLDVPGIGEAKLASLRPKVRI